MKNKSSSQSVLIGLFAVLTFAFCNSSARAQTYWTDATGDWFNSANWDNGGPPGVPYCGLAAYINNGGTAQINSSGATALSLTLGQNSSDSGSVSVDGTNGGTLVVAACDGLKTDIYVGYQGTGALKITNGGNVASGSGYIAASTSSSAASNGSVSVAGSSSTWQIGDQNTLHSVLFVGGNENGDGGTALLSITDGGTVTVQDNGNETSATVGPSGTVSGNGTLDTSSSKFQQLTDVKGTLAPNSTLTIGGNLRLETSAATVCNVTPSAADNVAISGTASLNGRLSVTMTGTFTCTTTRRFTLLYAAGGRDPNNPMFASVSIKYPTNQGFIPQITYDGDYVYLDLVFSNPPCD